MPGLDQLVDLYLGHLRVERALSEHTLFAYARDLGKLVDFAEASEIKRAQELDLVVVSGWLRDLSKRGLSPRSSARHLSALRGFVRFLLAEGELEHDPCALSARPRFGRRLPRALSESDVVRLIETPDPTTLRGLRDRAMLSMTYAAGLRVSELVKLKLGDLDLSRGVVAPLGKGQKRRLVPLGEVALFHLEAYLERRRAELTRGRKPPRARDSAIVFQSPRGGALTRQAFWKIVGRYARAAGIANHVHPHQLRHTFATHLVTGGADLRSVQTMLGHADIGTTSIYTHVSGDHVRKAHRRAHPRG